MTTMLREQLKMDERSDRGPSRLGWFTAGALTALAMLGGLALAGPYFEFGTADERIAQTPPIIIEGY